MRNRSRLETYLDLLQAVSEHRNPVIIGEQVDLSQSDAEEHLGFLASQGFIRTVRRENNIVEYELMQKGFETLEAFRRLRESEHLPLKHTLNTNT